MANKKNLKDWLVEALKKNNGNLTTVKASKYVWEHYENALKKSGDLFYTWQYDLRWAATELRKSTIMQQADISPRGIWELS